MRMLIVMLREKNKFTKYHYIYVNTKLGTGRMKVHILFPSSELIKFFCIIAFHFFSLFHATKFSDKHFLQWGTHKRSHTHACI